MFAKKVRGLASNLIVTVAVVTVAVVTVAVVIVAEINQLFLVT